MELYFPGLIKNHSRTSALGGLQSAFNKAKRVPRTKKKQLVKKCSTRQINFQLEKLTF